MLSTEFTKVITQWLNMTFWGIITAEICYKGRKIKKSWIGKTTWVVMSTNIDKKETSKALSVICIKLQKEKTTSLPWNPVNSRGYPITNPVIDSSGTCPPTKSFSHIYEIAEESPQEHCQGNLHAGSSWTKTNTTRIGAVITLWVSLTKN